jgi:hypothetical protein
MVSAPAARKIQNSAWPAAGCAARFGSLRAPGSRRAHEAEQQPHDQQVGVHHAGDVEGDGREQQVADQVLQAQRQTEDDLPGEQAERRDEVQLGDRLRLVFEGCGVCHVHCSSLSLRCWAATFRC